MLGVKGCLAVFELVLKAFEDFKIEVALLEGLLCSVYKGFGFGGAGTSCSSRHPLRCLFSVLWLHGGSFRLRFASRFLHRVN